MNYRSKPGAVKIETPRLPENVVESKPDSKVVLKNSRNRHRGMLSSTATVSYTAGKSVFCTP
jgi:hypothetical protein